MANFLTGMLGLDSGKATSKAAGQAAELLGKTAARSGSYIKTGEAKSADALNSAIGSFSPWLTSGTDANTMYANALGLNGADGNAAATSAFQTSPGYDWTLNNALQGSERAASAGGMLASGNLLTALQDRASQVANQEYGNWLSNLSGLSGQGLTAASGTAQGYTNLGSLYQNTANQRLGLDQYITNGMIGAYNQNAQGQEAQSAGLANLGSTVGDLLGTAFKGFSFS